MQNLVFATNNPHKLAEIRHILAGYVDIVSLSDIGCTDEIPETAPDLQGNALLKARYVYDKYHRYCFADDTGLEVEALEGQPGVHSARYAGKNCSMADNKRKLLEALADVSTPRRACFRTVIALIDVKGEHLFEGRIDGQIIDAERGDGGFGYDPLFVPDGYEQTFSELGAEIKDTISHRARAVMTLHSYLSQRDE